MRLRGPLAAAASALIFTVACGSTPVGGTSTTSTIPTEATGDVATSRAVSLPVSTPTNSWLVYHGVSLGTGNAPSEDHFASPKVTWTSATLDGQIYGEPLEYDNRVFVATENDTIYSLAADSGKVLWSTHVASAVPNGKLPCGDISPTVGFSGTPVIDPTRNEIFGVADETSGGRIHHELVGLDIFTGAVLLSQAADPPGARTKAILQRLSLTLAKGKVVFGYGGNDGDCTTYNGWVAEIPVGGGVMKTFKFDNTAPGEHQGSLWQGGAAPLVDSTGNIWLATGNGSVGNGSSTPYDDSDGVFEFSPTLKLKQFFAVKTWQQANSADADLGSAAPAWMPGGTMIMVGKSQTAFYLTRSHLGGIGGQLATIPVCPTNNADGGPAVSGTTAFIGCQGGIIAISRTHGTPAVKVTWKSSTNPGRPPTVAGGFVWTINGSTLIGLTAKSGTQKHSIALGATNDSSFPSIGVGAGLLLAPAGREVVAVKGTSPLPGKPVSPPPFKPGSAYWALASTGRLYSFGDAPTYGTGRHDGRTVVGMSSTSGGKGYWILSQTGKVGGYGNAKFLGNGPGGLGNYVGIAGMSTGGGYWLVTAVGAVTPFGKAKAHGTARQIPLTKPIVGIESTPTAGGYRLAASDGGVFSFGAAHYKGSEGGKPLNSPIVGMANGPTIGGYWLVAADGGIFSFGSAQFHGSEGAKPIDSPIVGMAPAPNEKGYWLASSDGGIYCFGSSHFAGSEGGLSAGLVAVSAAA